MRSLSILLEFKKYFINWKPEIIKKILHWKVENGENGKKMMIK